MCQVSKKIPWECSILSLELNLNHVPWKHHNPNFTICRYRYTCDGTNEAPEEQANPEQEGLIEINLVKSAFQPDSSLENQLQSNAVDKTNQTKVNPNFGRPESLQDFYIRKG